MSPIVLSTPSYALLLTVHVQYSSISAADDFDPALIMRIQIRESILSPGGPPHAGDNDMRHLSVRTCGRLSRKFVSGQRVHSGGDCQ